jgi:hypothetical protein
MPLHKQIRLMFSRVAPALKTRRRWRFQILTITTHIPGHSKPNISGLRSIESLAASRRSASIGGFGDCVLFYGSNPKMATADGVPTKTLPFTTSGVMNLLPLPK